jgi:hypothetical protein
MHSHDLAVGASQSTDEFWTEFYSYLFTLMYEARVNHDRAAQQELQRFREAEEPEVLFQDETFRRGREVLGFRDVIRQRRYLPVIGHWRPAGRERRPACNARTRGSRRVTRAGPSSDDDPHEDDAAHKSAEEALA